MIEHSIRWNLARAANQKNAAKIIANQAHCLAILDDELAHTVRSRIWVDVWASRLEQSTKEAD